MLDDIVALSRNDSGLFEETKDRIQEAEASEFPQLSIKYSVQRVPQTVINEREMIVGAIPEKQFLEKLLEIGRGESITE